MLENLLPRHFPGLFSFSSAAVRVISCRFLNVVADLSKQLKRNEIGPSVVYFLEERSSIDLGAAILH
jgi:hypothetical protein